MRAEIMEMKGDVRRRGITDRQKRPNMSTVNLKNKMRKVYCKLKLVILKKGSGNWSCSVMTGYYEGYIIGEVVVYVHVGLSCG